MKIATILGTRPEIIKLSPLLPLLHQTFDHFIIHTGQHYDYEMDQIFFKELRLPIPKYNLHVGSGKQGQQTGIMIEKIEAILESDRPDVVIVQGDTNTVLAGSLAAAKLHIPICHIEAGDRNFNRQSPEEINRIVADHISDYLLAADDRCGQNLLNEGIPAEKITITGNTIFDACIRNSQYVHASTILQELGLTAGKYAIVTVHRAESTEKKEVLQQIVEALNQISRHIPLVFPIHPRTKKYLEVYQLQLSPNIQIIKPVEYIPFLKLLSESRFIISESGGVQEEAVVFNVPCLIPLNETCWPKLVEAGKNFVVGQTTAGIVQKAVELLDDANLQKIKDIPFEYDKNVSEKIIEVLKNHENRNFRL